MEGTCSSWYAVSHMEESLAPGLVFVILCSTLHLAIRSGGGKNSRCLRPLLSSSHHIFFSVHHCREASYLPKEGGKPGAEVGADTWNV